MDRPQKRVALIAGGSGGIGLAVARRLLEDGHIVHASFRRNQEAAASLVDRGAKTFELDICDGIAVENACKCIFAAEGRLDILVNCAGLNLESPALAMEDEAWGKVMGANLDGAFRLARAAAKYMLLGRWGRIVNMSSIAATHGGRGQINYAASKAGVEAMTRVLALELGRKCILVNCVAPGVIETAMSDRVRKDYGEALLDSIAARRFGKPDEIAGAASFLVSESASYINGQVLHVDGGMCL